MTETVVTEQLPHYEQLQAHLGRLAELHSPAEHVENEAPPASELIILHSERIASYFAAASAEATVDTSETQIWERVEGLQLSELSNVDNPEAREELATNILVANLFAAHGLSGEERHTFLRDRVWKLATHRVGLTAIRAALKNIDLCVATDDKTKPFVSIKEPLEGYGGLLIATDRSVDFKTVDVPVRELEKASPTQQAWFIGMMAANQNFTMCDRNLAFIPDKRAMCEAMVENNRAKPGTFEKLGLETVMSQDDVIDYTIEHDKYPHYSLDISALPKEKQINIFDRMLSQHPEKLTGMLAWGTCFTKLGIDQVHTLIAVNYFIANRNASLSCFAELPPGSLKIFENAGVGVPAICASLKLFSDNERKAYYDKHVDNVLSQYAIFSNPTQFDVVDRETFLDKARETNNMNVVSHFIYGYTDGSDQTLITELIEGGHGESVAQKLAELPAIDVDWFVNAVVLKDDVAALIQCLPYTEKIDQAALFAKALVSEKPASLLQFTLPLFDQLDTDTMLDDLIKAGLFEVILAKPDIFIHQTRETILQKVADKPEAL